MSVRRAADATVGWPIAVGTLCFALTVARLPMTGDGYLDLVAGRLIASHGVPHVDTISLVGHGRGWVDQQWLAQTAMYGIWKLAGEVGLGFLLAVLVALAYGLLTRLCMVLGAPPQRAMLWALLAFLGSLGYTSVRAEMFSYPAFVLTLGVLVRDAGRRQFRTSFLWVFLILAIWANLHGAVLLGVVLVFGYCAARAGLATARRERRTGVLYATSALVSVVCPFATPYGLSEARYYRGVLSSSLLREYESEWRSPRLDHLFDWMTFMFAAAVIVAVVLALRKPYRPNPVLVLATLVTGALAFHTVRYQPWFALAGAAFLAATLGGIRPPPAALDSRFLRVGAAGLAVVALISAVSAAGHVDRATTARGRGALASAAQWESRHPGARILADPSTSDRLLWWYPETVGHVALDLRVDFYDPADVRDWFAYIFGPDFLRVGGSTYDVYVASSGNRSLYLKIRDATCLTVIYADRYGIAAVPSASSPPCRS
jgi:hypothetical protein